ncbi:hypothetical protein [Ancylobacter amanitiformis]|uniref:Uncharacterized protein n=1 Tax=Ancylobacter amanitiformis TaxID=217069 RepID=A0ABU0LUN5_9HYPH|nr:hypothetical protein [Ancylobacter amanitiformis]MDQ0512388.1 hypothetical protein [Ancylobacter amanitiformis]
MIKTAAAALCLVMSFGIAQAQTATSATAPAPAQPAPETIVADLPSPADCTFTKVFVCDGEKGCAPAKELGTIDLPARFLVHYGKRIIASVSDSGLPHISQIDAAASAGDNITLHGTEDLVGWIMQLSRTRPDVTLTTVSPDRVLTAFGTCTPAP